jgi:hypothetical protein
MVESPHKASAKALMKKMRLSKSVVVFRDTSLAKLLGINGVQYGVQCNTNVSVYTIQVTKENIKTVDFLSRFPILEHLSAINR